MIDIDIVKKPRKGDSGTASSGNNISVSSRCGYSDESGHAQNAETSQHAAMANEAAHAQSARELDGNSSVWQKIRDTVSGLSDRYLSKLSPDTAQKLITFLEGLKLGDGTHGIDEEGVAKLKAMLLDKASIDAEGNAVVESLKSRDFHAGLLDGRGYGIYKDAQGYTVGEIDKLIVRMKAIFAQLEVRKFAFTSGDTGYTGAGCRIERVTRLPNGDYRCYWLAEQDGVKIENAWHLGDEAMARTHNIISKVTSMAANRYYWRLVVGKGEETIDGRVYHYVDLSDTRGTLTLTIDGKDYTCVGYDTSVENDAPQAEDSIVQMGSQTDEERQYAYVVYVSEGKRVDYDGINDYDLDSHIVEIHSREENRILSDRFELVTGGNIRVPLVTERGAWVEGTTAYHYNHFSYANATWLCIVGKGQSTTEAPNEESGKWIKETYGIKGDRGDDGVPGKSSYTFLRYSNDGGQTFTEASQAAIDATASVPLEGRNVVFGTYREFVIFGVAGKVSSKVSYNSCNLGLMQQAGIIISFDLQLTEAVPYLNVFANSKTGDNAGWVSLVARGKSGSTVNNVEPFKEHFIVTVAPRDWYNFYIRLLLTNAAPTAQLIMSNLKVEVGSAATPWTPAPEDCVVGTTPGDYFGSMVWDKPYPSLDPAAYVWSKTKGESITISSTSVTYQVGDSATEAPTGTWQATVQAAGQGKYLWTKTTVAYSDGKSTTSYTVSRQGVDGASVKVQSTSAIYAVKKDSMQPLDSEYSTTLPTLAQGDYLWTKTTVAFDDGSAPLISYSVSRIGTDGNSGVITHFAYATSADGSQGFSTTAFAGYTYIGVYTDPTEAGAQTPDPKDYKSYKWTPVKGEDGRGITSVDVVYNVSNSSTVAPTEWVTNAPALPEGTWLWTANKVTYSDGTSAITGATCLVSADKVATVTEQYATSQSNSSAPTSGWYDIPNLNWMQMGDGWYMWTRSKIDWQDGKTTYSSAVCVKGDAGADGAAGKDAVTVRLVPDKVVVDTDNNGQVTETQLANAVAKVEVWKGNSPYVGSVSIYKTSDNIGAEVSNEYTVKVESIGIDPSTMTEGDPTSGYAYAQGWVDVNVNVDDVVYKVRLTIETNIHKVVAAFKQTATKINASVSTFKTEVDKYQKQTDARLTVAEGIISLKVKSTMGSVGRNILGMGNTGLQRKTGVTGSGAGITRQFVFAATAGMTYTITFKAYSSNGQGYRFFCWGPGNDWSNQASSEVLYNTSSSVGAFKITTESSGNYNIYATYAGATSQVGSFNLEWVRVDEGDYTGEGYMPRAWEPSAVETEEPNLLPDYNFETAIDSDYTSALQGTREFYDSQDDGSLLSDMSFSRDSVGMPVVTFDRSWMASGAATNYSGLVWYIPFRGAGKYTLSASMMKDNKRDAGNIVLEMIPCRADRSRINNSVDGVDYNRNVASWNYPNDYSWAHGEVTVDIQGRMAEATKLLEVRLYMTHNGTARVCRISVAKCAHAVLWNAQDIEGSAARETFGKLAAGVDVYRNKVIFTADNIEGRNQRGEPTVLIDKEGNIVAGSLTTRSANGQYTHIDHRGFELGKMVENVPKIYFDLAQDANGNVVLRYLDGNGNVHGYIDASFFNSKAYGDTFSPVKLCRIGALSYTPTWDDVKFLASSSATTYYQFSTGFSVNGSGLKTYNYTGTAMPPNFEGNVYTERKSNLDDLKSTRYLIPDGLYAKPNDGFHATKDLSSNMIDESNIYYSDIVYKYVGGREVGIIRVTNG